MRTILLLCVIVWIVLYVTACRNGGTTAMLAVIKSADQGIAAFTKWAVLEEDKIATETVARCQAQSTRAAYDICASDYVRGRRAPIDKAKLAIGLYGAAVEAAHGAQTQDVADAARAVTSALAAIGIFVGGGR